MYPKLCLTSHFTKLRHKNFSEAVLLLRALHPQPTCTSQLPRCNIDNSSRYRSDRRKQRFSLRGSWCSHVGELPAVLAVRGGHQLDFRLVLYARSQLPAVVAAPFPRSSLLGCGVQTLQPLVEGFSLLATSYLPLAHHTAASSPYMLAPVEKFFR
jgi:hypothetical protein